METNDEIISTNRDTIDSNRSRRSTSYCGSATPTPITLSRRSSLAFNPSQTITTTATTILPNQQQTIINPNVHINGNGNSNNGIYGTTPIPNQLNQQNMNSNFSPSPILSTKTKEKLHHRYSTTILEDPQHHGIPERRMKKNKLFNRGFHSMNETIEVLADPVVEDDSLGERTSWEYHTVTVTRVPGYGFGIAVSGGRDNPHFANGDPSIAVSDVLKAGPAEDRLQVNDRIISVNGVSLENVEYATAVQVLRDSGNTVTLVIKRRVPNLNMLPQTNHHSHQHSHSLSSTGLGIGNNIVNLSGGMLGGVGVSGIGASGMTGNISQTQQSQQTIKLFLTKSNKKDDFGIVLGCRLFIKEISSKARDQLASNGYQLQEGDIVSRIHNTNCNDAMSLKESKKIIDGCKERLNLVVLRELPSSPTIGNNNNNNNNHNNSGMQSPVYSHTAQVSNCSNNIDETFLPGGPSYSAQNLYVQPPTRPAISTLLDDKSNLTPRGRSRGPLMDVSLSQLDRPSTPQGTHIRSRSGIDEPPRPPPPRGEDFYSSRRQLYDDDPLQRSKQSAEPRFISFQKEGSVGIRLTGGNEAGIFVTAVQPGSPASLQGLTPGDKILKVNEMDMNGFTREEAVLFLLSLQDRIDLIVQHCKDEYDTVVANQRGDSFHIKTHFHYENPSKGEMSFKAGDVFRVIDTLHNGVVGSWQVLRIGRGQQEMQRGVIPNKSRAEELATAQFNQTKKEMNASESRGNFFRRRRSTHRRSKSLSRENWDDVVFSDSISKFPAYERVVLRHPGFVRPVVLFGAVSDIARDRLIKDFPDKFTAPLDDGKNGNANKSGIVRLSNIRDIMDRGKHALLDITPNAVDRLNYAQFYPIVIFLKADTKHIIKQLRQGIPKSAHKSSKKLLEQCQKLERVWSHVFSTSITLNDADIWYRKLRESVDQQQSGAVWMSETKPVESLSDDFLFPMTTSRLSYASSPESDLELSPGPSASLSLGNLPQLVKSSSDPSIATNQDNLDRDRELNVGEGMPPPYTNPYEHATSHVRRSTIDSKYGFAANGSGPAIPPDSGGPTYSTANRPPPPIHGQNQSIYGTDLPPRVDRASKPPGLNTPGQPTNPAQSRSSGGTIGRSAQERLFGTKLTENPEQDEYASRNNFEKRGSGGNSMERNQSSLDRQRGGSTVKNNGSYDSVSSYDSYNTTQISGQNTRLGPNAPDDLKSVPNTNGRTPATANQLPIDYRNSNPNDSRNGISGTGHNHTDSTITNRPSIHEHSRSLSSGANDLNRQNSPGRPPYPGDRNIGMSPHDQQQMRPSGVTVPQRPTNLGLDGSPRKHVVETKTDYGKYSRNNSATQADYKTPPPVKTQQQQQQQQIGPPSGTPFKPVPPPKPKNYRPPIQGGGSNGNGGQVNAGQWDGEPKSPRSPNGFFYPSTPSHYHHTQHNTPSSPNSGHRSSGGGNGGNGPPPQMHHYNHQYSGNGNYSSAQQMQYNNREQITTNGYNGNHPYAGQYMHRSPGIANMPHHPSDRHALDLAGSREQRGSAFELYRKPQIGSVGHHHNIRMEPPHSYHSHSSSSSAVISNELNERQQYNCDTPPLPPPKTKKKLLKSPLAAIKNAFIRTTRPLRRQSSMIESDKKSRPNLRRQHSLMEQRPSGRIIEINPNDPYQRHYFYASGPQYPLRHEPFYPTDGNSTYQNLESESIYGYSNGQGGYYDQEHMYANRALIELERGGQRQYSEPKYGGGRIVRRHSLAERSTAHYSPRFQMHRQHHEAESVEPIYQTQGGSYMMENNGVRERTEIRNEDYLTYQNRRSESIYQNRREMHRDHLYQSRSEMQERINIGKREVGLAAIESPTYATRNEIRAAGKDPVYQSRKELKENGFKTRTQLRDHIYQSRREAMESMAEPIYVSKREIKHEPIYETKESDIIEASCAMEKLDLSIRPEPSGQENDQNEEQEITVREIDDIPHIDDDDEDDTLTNNNQSDLQKSSIIPPAMAIINENARNEKLLAPLSPRALRSPYHISNVIKRTAGASSILDKYASRTSVETHYQSQASLPIGPPNAQSTPYNSEMSIGYGGNLVGNNFPTPRQPSITRGIFTDKGGTLSDPIWNVSLIIPEGAIPPDVQQEIHFKITDPRMSQEVGGPPLDMDNGEQMLSPLVMCGPQGLEFLVPVTLNIPHSAARTPSLGLSLKATDSEKNLRTDWDNIELPSNTAAHTVSVKVDHF